MGALNYTVIDLSESSMGKTVVLIEGEREVVVVDAGFTRADGHRIVAALLDAGTTPTAVLITGGDPDFYFGTEVIADAFPSVRFLAPQDVIDHIQATFETKLDAWSRLGENLPTRLVEIHACEGTIEHEGTWLELRRAAPALGERGWVLWDRQARVLLGGTLLFDGVHVWTADTPAAAERAAWLAALDDLCSLDPLLVIAGHRAPWESAGRSAISYTRDYLRLFEQTIEAAPSAAAATRTLIETFPEAGHQSAAEIGPRVAMGEVSWG